MAILGVGVPQVGAQPHCAVGAMASGRNAQTVPHARERLENGQAVAQCFLGKELGHLEKPLAPTRAE